MMGVNILTFGGHDLKNSYISYVTRSYKWIYDEYKWYQDGDKHYFNF